VVPRTRLAELHGLYGIVDDSGKGRLGPVDWARALAQGGASAVQLRIKQTPMREALILARALRAALPRTLLIINDRIDLALLCGADGAHVGSGDLSPADARRILGPGRLLGATARSLAEARAALAAGADHVGFGPIFRSSTKPLSIEPLGLRALASTCRELGSVPVVAVSGIDAGNVAAVAQTGAACAAVTAAVGRADDPAAAARQLADAFESGRPDRAERRGAIG
jgi:thiamine-phosphate pyrophosphorylase